MVVRLLVSLEKVDNGLSLPERAPSSVPSALSMPAVSMEGRKSRLTRRRLVYLVCNPLLEKSWHDALIAGRALMERGPRTGFAVGDSPTGGSRREWQLKRPWNGSDRSTIRKSPGHAIDGRAEVAQPGYEI